MKFKHIYLNILGLIITGIAYPQISVNKLESKIAIDGQLDELVWNLSTQLSVNTGLCNNTASFGLLWDDEYLYVGIQVTDAFFILNGRQGWYDDGVEIYIDVDNSKSSGIESDDRLLVKPVKMYWIEANDENNEGILHKYYETADGYSMEFAIPWSNLNKIPAVGSELGFNIAVNDDDAESYQTISNIKWMGSQDYYNKPSEWGTISLSDQLVSVNDPYLALICPNGEDFLINGQTNSIQWLNKGPEKVNLEISTDNGNNWLAIATDINASDEVYEWVVSAEASEDCLLKVSDANNAGLFDLSLLTFTVSNPLTAVLPLILNEWDNYAWPYNAYFPEYENGINGRVGNACGHSSIARILHKWEFPIVGNDELTFTDSGGATWSANFGETYYNYDNMPLFLPANSTEVEYTDVATLFYHSATSMHDIGGSGGDLNNMSYAFSHYFSYKESVPAYRENYKKNEWISLLKNELDQGRPLLIQGMTLNDFDSWRETNSISGHWFHLDGYDEDGKFHVVIGYGNNDGYYDIDSIPDFAYNNGILTGLEPNLNGKEINLETLNGNEVYSGNLETEIVWQSKDIDDIKIEYTIDNGKNWELITNSPASAGSYMWTTPDINSDDCKIRISDATNINIYDKSNETFAIKPYELDLITPNNGDYFMVGEIVSIGWGNTPVSNIKIEYSRDNGSNWSVINENTPASEGIFKWIAPNINSELCKLRITDVLNESVMDESSVFEIAPANHAGGPYTFDDNIILLMNLDNDLSYQGTYIGNVSNWGAAASYEASLDKFNQCFRLNNSSSQQCILMDATQEMDLGSNWTIECWIKVGIYGTGNATHPNIFIKDGFGITAINLGFRPDGSGFNSYLRFNNDSELRIQQDNGISIDEWNHIALISDSVNQTVTLAVHDQNWNLVFSQSKAFPVGSNGILCEANRQMYIGGVSGGSNIQFDGWIDEFRVSNDVRGFEHEFRANFMANKIDGENPLEIQFTDLSSVGNYALNQWEWDFGDGLTSTQQNPTHSYTSSGTYTVGLLIKDLQNNEETEIKTSYIQVTESENPYADFTSDVTTGIRPLEVNFTDQSLQGTEAIIQRDWDFGDGTNSTDHNPAHTYQEAGVYTVTLTVTDLAGNTDTKVKTDFITVSNPDPPIANFTSNLTSGSLPLEVEFTDLSAQGTGSITSWNWDFGDGESSADHNPAHTYNTVGKYTVTLNIEDEYGLTDNEMKPNYIEVYILPEVPATPQPENQANDVSINVSLGWTICENTESVDLYFGTVSPPISKVLNNVSATTNYNPSTLNYQTNYFWKVVCKNAYGATEGPIWTFTTAIGTGITDNPEDDQLISIYPNPSNSFIKISSPVVVDLSIYNISGQRIYEQIEFREGELDVSSFNKGHYIVVFTSKKGRISKDLIIN